MKKWVNPAMVVVEVDMNDVIATSGGGDVPSGDIEPSTNTNSVIWEDKTGDKF